MKKYASLILTLFICINIQAQNKLPSQNRFISLGTTPFNLFEPTTSTLEGVLEFRPIKQVSFELKYGWQGGISSGLTRRLEDEYSEVKFGMKYWPFEKDEFFWGVEYFQVNHEYGRTNDFFRENGATVRFNTAKVSRTIIGTRLRTGYVHTFASGINTELYAGAGVRDVDIFYHSVTGMGSFFFNEGRLFSINDNEVGSKIKFDVNIGIKISWRFIQW